MPGIDPADLEVLLTTTAGSAGYSLTQADPNASLGKYASTTVVDQGDTLHNLFDKITGDENRGQVVEYRAIALRNGEASRTWEAIKVWVSGKRCTAVGSTDVITSTAHGFLDGHRVRVEAELPYVDALPSGLSAGTTYYVRDKTDDTFKLATTLGGSAIDIGDSAGFSTRRFGTTTVEIGLDPAGAVAEDSASAQGAMIANETTAPAGVSFSSPTTKATGLALGDLEAGELHLIWVKRTPLNSGPLDNDGAVLGKEGDSPE